MCQHSPTFGDFKVLHLNQQFCGFIIEVDVFAYLQYFNIWESEN